MSISRRNCTGSTPSYRSMTKRKNTVSKRCIENLKPFESREGAVVAGLGRQPHRSGRASRLCFFPFYFSEDSIRLLAPVGATREFPRAARAEQAFVGEVSDPRLAFGCAL